MQRGLIDWRRARRFAKNVPMNISPFRPLLRDQAAAQEDRIRHELALIAAGQAELDAGLGLDWDDVMEWLDRLDTDPDAPMPSPRLPPPSR